jgi:hypothetical protein
MEIAPALLTMLVSGVLEFSGVSGISTSKALRWLPCLL